MINGKIISLLGKTRHGKNRVNEHGTLWLVLPLPKRVPTWPTGSMLLQSVQTNYKRWLTDYFEVPPFTD